MNINWRHVWESIPIGFWSGLLKAEVTLIAILGVWLAGTSERYGVAVASLLVIIGTMATTVLLLERIGE